MSGTRMWLRRNAIGFLLIPGAVALLMITVVWPAKRELDYRTPTEIVPAGQVGNVEGARLTLKRIEPDLTARTYSGQVKLERQDGTRPADGDVLVYEFAVEPAAGAAENPPQCTTAATDGTRRWFAANLSSIRSWSVGQGLAGGYCTFDKSFVVAFVVPKNADVVAVDLLISPAPEGDAIRAESLGHVIRFQTR